MEWQIHSVLNIQGAEYNRRFDHASSNLNELFLAVFLADSNVHGLVNDYPTTTNISFRQIPAIPFVNCQNHVITAFVQQAVAQMNREYARSIHRGFRFNYGVETSENSTAKTIYFEIPLIKGHVRERYNDLKLLVNWGERYVVHRLFRAIPDPHPLIQERVKHIEPPEMVYSMFKKLFI